MLNASSKFIWMRLLVILILLIIYSFPNYWMVVTSLQPPRRLLADTTPYVIPRVLTLESYDFMIHQPGFIRQFYNSVVVAIGSTVLSTVLATLAAYGFSRFRFKARDFLTTGILIFQMFPKIMLAIPYFIMMRTLHLLNTHLALILAYTSFTQPFCVWLLIGFFDAIPTDLDDCALVDGASRLGAFVRVVLPLAAPGVAATALFAFVLAWQEFLFSLILAVHPDAALLPQGLASMIGEWETLYQPMMAGAVMVSIPVVLVYVLLERYFVSGLTAGAVKG